MEDGTPVIPSKILSSIYSTLQNKYDSNKGKTDLHIALKSSSKETKNRFIYEIPINKFYEISSMFNQNAPTKEQWDTMTNEDIVAYIKQLFTFDAQLIKADVKVVGGDKKGIYETLDESAIKKAWNNYMKTSGADMTYKEILKLVDTNRYQAIGLLTPSYKSNNIFNC